MVLAAGEHFGKVHGADVRTCARERALNLHEATRVEGDYGLGAGFHNGVDLSACHGAGEVGKLHRKGAAEAAALFRRHHFPQFETLHMGEQSPGSALDAEFAQGMTSIVEGHHLMKACANVLYTGDFRKKCGKLTD